MAEKIFHNPAEHGCHFYEKFDSLSYTVKHRTRFRILHGKCWHTVDTQVVDVLEILQVRAVNK